MKDLILQFFQARSFPELAGAVRSRAETVLARWETASREILPSADQLTHDQLRDSLPDTLESLAHALESNRPTPTRTLLTESQQHGEIRFLQSYNLAELLIEFDVLRPILMEETALCLGREISLGELIALNMGVDLAARRSVLAFVNYQKRELESAANAHAKYLSFMSHDVRGGLNAILLSTDVLYQELADQPQFREALSDVETIKRNILETVATMDRFLRAEQLRSGKVTPNLAPTDLKEVVAEMAARFRHQAAAKGLHLAVETPDHCVVTTDRELLVTILQNLVGNAIKYTVRGDVRLTLTAVPGDGCTISVSDAGPGISAERMEQLFTPFVRGETHGQTGVGLGLYIARQAAEILGATLRAESKIGQGSTFALHLPG